MAVPLPSSNTTINVSGTSGAGYALKFTTAFQSNGSASGAWATNAQDVFNLTNADVILDAGWAAGGLMGGFTVNSTTGNTLTVNGNITNTGSRTTAGIVNSGTLTLNNTMSGAFTGTNYGFFVTLNGGTLNINNAGAIRNNSAISGTRAGLAIAGGTLNNTSGAAITLTYNPTVLLNGDFAFGTSGSTSTNSLNLGTGAASLGPNTGTARTITVNGSATLTVGGVIATGTTATALIKAGTGTLKLSGANTFTGGTTINAGTLTAANAAALGTGATTVSGGTLDLNGTSVQAVSGITNLTLSSGTIAFTLTSAASFDQISGSGAFTLSGGTIDLTSSVTNYASTYQILNFTSGGTVSGLSIVNYDTADYVASVSTTGVLSFAAVPEPTTWTMLIGGLGMASLLRRRRTV
ncbi:MAG: autotransporter-associated beta strand repeat-containing protein [Chthoniobacteraceae bacterium]